MQKIWELNQAAIHSWDGIGILFFYFTIYSFIGWLLENSYNFAQTKTFFKEGFFWGPFKPMYGFATVLLVNVITPQTSWMIMVLLCFFIPSVIEFLSGALLHKFFNKKWWDYSNQPLQFQGHICLGFSICWFFLAVICIKWVHPRIVSFYEGIQAYWILLFPVIISYFLFEFYMAIRRHSVQTVRNNRIQVLDKE